MFWYCMFSTLKEATSILPLTLKSSLYDIFLEVTSTEKCKLAKTGYLKVKSFSIYCSEPVQSKETFLTFCEQIANGNKNRKKK